MKTILVDAVNAFVIETKNGYEVFDGMRELLDSYPNRKIILTGANDEQYKEFALDTMPYEVFTLKHDPEKTNREYYTTMLARFGLSAADVVYFEHDPDAVQSATSVGIKSFHYDETKRDLDTLKHFLDSTL